VTGRQLDDEVAMNEHQPARCNDHAAVRRAREGGNCAIHFRRIACVDLSYLYPQRRRQCLDDAKLAYSRRRRRIAKHCDARYRRRNLLEQFQPFPADAEFECHEPGGIPPGPGQVLDETGADRIGDDHKHNRHRPRHLQQRAYRRGAWGQDDIRRQCYQFGGMPANGIGIRRCPAGIDLHISADAPSPRLQTLQEGAEPRLVMRIVSRCGEEHADAAHTLALLRVRG
jgi:hypothetical protein